MLPVELFIFVAAIVVFSLTPAVGQDTEYSVDQEPILDLDYALEHDMDLSEIFDVITEESRNDTDVKDSLLRPAILKVFDKLPNDRNFTFSCSGRYYGYYADMETDCKYFHICSAIYQDYVNPTPLRFSFECPNGTIFNQETVDCEEPEMAIPCEKSPDFFYLNEELEVGKDNGTIEENPLIATPSVAIIHPDRNQ